MNINVKVEKDSKENSIGLIRRFTKRVRGSGILTRVRGLRYYQRQPSSYVKKKQALKSIVRREKKKELIKLGKITEQNKKFIKKK
ncbi:MAG: hypothetical protein A3C63_00865 [Candidatus Zambryskibacteria bacterium RIFCSPHIGHO2_02_FULL_39_82]|uniref:30S ribosomal protein S21 n=1 Tax=Candidatus Campbellbacteria bacterium RIFCSPLOWO2_02_35_12 TaxID=1797580 RepID=A0A1F5EI77_9BACT|nr:MAG: hypothetical protein A2Z61_01310 [Candidatus Campbellbacteria bacterium RIFCSPLOWO2_02_35_12]OHA95440.1 MAG: hypothetical protein A3C63_00865 [Candidatus Zambryskibacteria bacterium RIFCSPHIGHO2_02_FULL_39_82]